MFLPHFIGTKISNITKAKNSEWNFDQRFYIKHNVNDGEESLTSAERVAQASFYNLDDDDFKKDDKAVMHRITLWVANTLNSPTEFCSDIGLNDQYLVRKKSSLQIWPLPSDAVEYERYVVIPGQASTITEVCPL